MYTSCSGYNVILKLLYNVIRAKSVHMISRTKKIRPPCRSFIKWFLAAYVNPGSANGVHMVVQMTNNNNKVSIVMNGENSSGPTQFYCSPVLLSSNCQNPFLQTASILMCLSAPFHMLKKTWFEVLHTCSNDVTPCQKTYKLFMNTRKCNNGNGMWILFFSSIYKRHISYYSVYLLMTQKPKGNVAGIFYLQCLLEHLAKLYLQSH